MNVRASALAFGLGLLSMSSVWACDAADIRREYQQIKAAQARDWMDAEFGLAAEWAVFYLNNHPEATGLALNKWMDGLGPNADPHSQDCPSRAYTFSGTAARTAPRVYVVSATFLLSTGCLPQGQSGIFFVIAAAGGKYREAWRSDAPEDAQSPDFACIFALPPAANGHPRFYIQGESTIGASALLHGRLSVWEWNGKQAVAWVSGDYRHLPSSSTVCCDNTLHFDGTYLRVRTKEWFKVFDTYGGRPDPEGQWTILVTPQSIVDLGVRRFHPELDLVDDLYDRVKRNLDATDIATHAVIAALTKTVPHDKPDWNPILNYSNLKGSKLCVSLSANYNEDPGHIFTLSRDGGRLFVAGIQDTSPEFTGRCEDAAPAPRSGKPQMDMRR